MEGSKQKVFVLGFDGATMDFIKPMVEEGQLPNMARLMEGGAFGKLRSVIPPNSAPAWVSFATGKNPAKHGVYTFFTTDPGKYQKVLVNSLSVRARTVWDLLGDHKRYVAVVGIPITYPPKPVNGVMISGLPIPSEKSTFTYPSTLHAELLVNCGEYVLPQSYMRRFMRRDLINALIEIGRYTDSKKQAVLYLMDTRPWDFFAVVFYTTDVIQHYTLRFQDEQYCRTHRRDADKLKDLIPQVYQKMDKVLGEIMSRLDDDTTLVVMSDHGGHRQESRFYVNRWLAREGYQTLKQERWYHKLQIARPRLGDIARRLGVPKICPGPLKKVRVFAPRIAHRGIAATIDWQRTRAFADITTSPVFITINLKGRQHHGLVDGQVEYEQLRKEIIEGLMPQRDHLGRPIFDRIYKREEIYNGPYLDEAPDIEMETIERRVRLMKDLAPGNLVERPAVPMGMHHMDGVVFLHGKHIRPGQEIFGAEIVDITPTVLHLMGLPIPEDMDGHVLSDALNPVWLDANPVQTQAASPEEGISAPCDEEMSEEEKQRIESELEALGYI
jgi:predicted AlkP superfamily phosphohydrolase/phosphomutase